MHKAKDSFGARRVCRRSFEIAGEVQWGNPGSDRGGRTSGKDAQPGGMFPREQTCGHGRVLHLMDSDDAGSPACISPQENVNSGDEYFKKGAPVLQRGGDSGPGRRSLAGLV